jgi:hypothetical protein
VLLVSVVPPPVAVVTPDVELVVPPVVLVVALSVLTLPPLLHPVAPTVMTNTDNTVSLTKTEHTRFSMVPPVAREPWTLYQPPGYSTWKYSPGKHQAWWMAAGASTSWGESNTKRKAPGEKHGH